MKQVTQTLRTGEVEVNEVPIPSINDTSILVKNTVSVISAGTEKTKIDMGKKNLLQKAKARPDLVKQVLQKVNTEGLRKTLRTVKSRLDSPSPLGYSCTGTVVAAGGLVEGIQPGDRVACGGADYANHAEFVSIPRNLIARVPDNVSDEEAAFTTVGAIALQGVRLAEPKLGETFLVLGLGLLGQIAVQLLRANGCNVIATDLDIALVNQAKKFGAIAATPGSDIAGLCKELTSGHGVDGVLVCAGTASNQPIELCGEATRSKGRVVVVGAVRMDIPREDYFKKEISIVISRSYGPGRYDPFYEENGNDYPLAYVRFTEQRNMQTFLDLISQKKVDVTSLVSHRFTVEQAAEAYHLIEGAKKEPYLGILMQYQSNDSSLTHPSRIETNSNPINSSKIGLSFFGAGNYATASLLPPIVENSKVQLRGLVTASGRTAQGVAKQFGFSYCAAEFDEILTEDTDAIMVTTRHDTHASSVIAAVNAQKHVYVEKPLALTVNELALIDNAKQSNPHSQIMVGFNRRFAPCTKHVINHFKPITTPLIVNIRVNAGHIPKEHWIQDPHTGGGRIIGEGCHFVDLASAIVQSNPKTVHAFGTARNDKSALLNDNVIINLSFENGSVASITYISDGSKALQKEYVEVFGGGRSAVINDFKEAILYSSDTTKEVLKQPSQDKGQSMMINSWIDSLKSGESCIDYNCLLSNSLASIMAVESMMIGSSMNVDLSILSSID
ncbi:oxidoreductase [Grimontia sp. AD028]|uniref:bi-domain-containing oxidoreductase n=1 Tax=Grimontia sp. AD028 TaxID=1581149 RepID=UPI00061AA4E4|nr:bi-domain-containing oxidoreductase [Grimontia sp. AD028]KKD59393.1 oxidoreductase [Grimontia sp. AD028]